MEFYVVKAILHLVLKSFYEFSRTQKIGYPKMYWQIQVDVYFLFTSSILYIFHHFTQQVRRVGTDSFGDPDEM